MQAQSVKNDRNDARGIAHMMRTGWFRAVHVKSTDSQKLRVLLGNRRFLLQKRFDIEYRIRGTLKAFGHKVGKVSVSNYEPRIRELLAGDAQLSEWVEPLLEARRTLLEQFKRLQKAILAYVHQDDVCRRLMSIPGVGPFTALVFKTSIDRPERFAKSADVGAALGLTPRKYASGPIDYDGRITKCGDALARTHLYEAAKVLLSRVTKWSAIKAWGLRIARRSSMKNACVAVARKLAVLMHRIWIDGSTFQWSTEPKNATRSVVTLRMRNGSPSPPFALACHDSLLPGFSGGEHTTWHKAASDAGCSDIGKFDVCLHVGGLAGVRGNGENPLG